MRSPYREPGPDYPPDPDPEPPPQHDPAYVRFKNPPPRNVLHRVIRELLRNDWEMSQSTEPGLHLMLAWAQCPLCGNIFTGREAVGSRVHCSCGGVAEARLEVRKLSEKVLFSARSAEDAGARVIAWVRKTVEEIPYAHRGYW